MTPSFPTRRSSVLGDYVRPVREQPGERNLRLRYAMRVRHRADRVNDREVGGEIFVRIARVVAAPVALGQLVAAAHRAREDAAAERRIGDEADAMQIGRASSRERVCQYV